MRSTPECHAKVESYQKSILNIGETPHTTRPPLSHTLATGHLKNSILVNHSFMRKGRCDDPSMFLFLVNQSSDLCFPNLRMDKARKREECSLYPVMIKAHALYE